MMGDSACKYYVLGLKLSNGRSPSNVATQMPIFLYISSVIDKVAKGRSFKNLNEMCDREWKPVISAQLPINSAWDIHSPETRVI